MAWVTRVLLRWIAVAGMLASGGLVAQGTPIMAYHRFDPVKAGSTTVTTATFESQMAWIAEHHYTVVPLAAVIEDVKAKRAGKPNTIAITVDDGHISVFTILFPLIQKYRIPVTLFLYPSAISNAPYALTWEQVKQMKASGLVDIEAHTYWHPDFRREKKRLTPEEYQKFVTTQLVRSKAVLEQKLGSPITTMAWPYGIYDAELEQAAARAGYTASFGYAGGVARPGDDLFAIPRIPAGEYAHGAAFGTMLNDQQAHPGGKTAGKE